MLKKNIKKLIVVGTLIGEIFTLINYTAKKQAEDMEINMNNPYLSKFDQKKNERMKQDACPKYEEVIKPTIDKILSFIGLVVLVPVFIGISIVIYLDDPGKIFFTQTRVGKDKEFFQLHKFRTMKLTTPHDVPTHQLKDSDQYITKVGRILRKYSLDELPQIWDIYRGKMSIIGPRPALWNQIDLVAERDKYSANNIKPGLTGWAQINGRDELGIIDKAKLDGEYVDRLNEGGLRAFRFDCRCFFETAIMALRHNGVVEGGTGKVQRNGK